MEPFIQFNPVALSLLIPALISGGLTVFAFARRSVVGSRVIAFLMLAMCVWSIAYAVELSCLQLDGMMASAAVEYLGIATVPVLWLILTLLYTGREDWVTRRNTILLFVIPAITIVLVATNQWHHLFYSSTSVDASGSFPLLAITRGLWFWVHSAYSYAMLLAATFLLILRLGKPGVVFRNQVIAMLIGMTAPWLASVLYVVFGLMPLGHLDPTPFAFVVTCVVMAWSIFRYRLFDLVPMANDTVVDSINDAVVVLDKKSRIVGFNKAAHTILEISQADIGEPAAIVWKEWPKLLNLSQSNESGTIDTMSSRPDSMRYYEAAAFDVADRYKRVLGKVISLHDITDRKQAGEALRESEERYRTMLEQAADAVFMHDETGRILDVNQKTCHSLGYSREELLSMSIEEIDPEAIKAGKHELWGKILAGEQFTFESRQVRKDGSAIPVEVTLGSVRLPLGAAVLGIVRDITERKQLEKETAKARADFLFAVSHELKTPLFLMTAMMELIKSKPDGERQQQFLAQEETWIRNLARLRLLINNLVDSQRTADLGTQLNRIPTDLASLVRQATEDIDIFAVKQSVTWQLDLDPLPDLPLDPEAIERTLHNLLSNAVKFSSPGGIVQIRLRTQPDSAVLEVEDHGKGIPASEMSHLFQPFARAGGSIKAVIPGTGLGLYVSKILVEAHGGAISLRSEEGVGTTVTVTLPRDDKTEMRRGDRK
ncbi:MAG: histidine kinase N-terminal 7TM domain-containing protein [bacterium]